MKNVFLTLAVVVSLMAMSFTTNDKKSNFKEVKLDSKTIMVIAGKFTRYEDSRYTSSKQEWYRRMEVWSVADNSGSTNELENTLSQY